MGSCHLPSNYSAKNILEELQAFLDSLSALNYSQACLRGGVGAGGPRRPLLKGFACLLLLLYVWAAFDTEDHAILLRCLLIEGMIKGCALDWFQQFFVDRI